MTQIRIAIKFFALVAVTAVAVVLPALVWLFSLGRPGPASWIGSRCCRLWSRASLRIVGVKTVVRSKPDRKLFLVAANHLSYLDIWVLGALYPSLFVAKREIRAWPLLGWVISTAGTIFVDRESPRDLVRTAEAMTNRLARGIPLTLFPEGKATPGESVLPFMPSLFESAARTGVPCYAASLSYETPGSPEPPSETVCWYGGQPLIPHVWKLLSLPRIEATVRFSAEPLNSANRKELARELHGEVRGSFVPVRQVPRENVG